MRKLSAIALAALTSLFVATFVVAQPAGGPGLLKIVHTSAFTGNGTNTSQLDLTHACANGEGLKWNGAAWICGSSGITNGAGANVIPKSDGTNLVASSLSDNGTTVSTAESFSISNTSATADTMTVTHTPSSGTASTKVIYGIQQGSVDTTASAKTMTGVRGEATTTRAAGANTLTNAGVVGVANGSPVSNYGIWSIVSGTGSDNRGVQVEQTGTGALNYGVHILVNGAGQSNIGLKVGAVNGSVTNRAFEASDGDVVLNSQSGFTSITGHGSSSDVSLTDATAGSSTANTALMSIASTKTFNTTAAPLTEYTCKLSSSATRSSGTNALNNTVLDVTANGSTGTNNTAIHATATSGSGNNIALQTDAGDVKLCQTSGALAVGGAATFNAPITVQDFRGTVITPSALASGNTNDYAPTGLSTATVIDVDADAAGSTITGLTGGTNGRRVTFVYNSTAGELFFANESASSSAANRFNLPFASTINLSSHNSGEANAITFVYSGAISRWVEESQTSDSFAQINVGTGSITTLSAGTASVTDLAISNGITGVNGYGGKHLEGSDEWLMVDATFATGTTIGSGYSLVYTGTGAGLQQGTAVSGRPGVVGLHIGTATSGSNATISSAANAVDFSEGSWSYAWAGDWPTLSSSSASIASEYVTLIGFFDTTTENVVDGCYFAYDKGNVMTGGVNPSNVDALECWCASNSVRTGYLINGTGNSDESFPLGTGTIAAATYYRLKIVMTGTTRAEFYRNDTKVCDINTNIPSGSTRGTGFGFEMIPKASSGTGDRTLETDQTTWAVDLTSARSP